MQRVNWVSCCAVVALVTLNTPCHARAQSQGQAVARKAAAALSPPCHCVGADSSPTVQRIRQALRSPLKSSGLEFHDTSLEVVVRFLREEYAIPIQIDQSALADIGLAPDDPVTIHLRDISLKSALRLMLRPIGLTYVLRDEVLLITSLEEADVFLVNCVYDVHELVGAGNSDPLIDVIVNCVAADTWAENGGGEAEIRSLGHGLLVISQTEAVHDEIRELLRAVSRISRRTSAGQASDGDALLSDADTVVTRNYSLVPMAREDRQLVSRQVANLIVQAMPDERWKGKLDSGEAVLLMVLSDRVVLQHRRSVQRKVRTLLEESGLTVGGPASSCGSGGTRSVIAAGEGRGGGSFRDTPSAAEEPYNQSDVEEDP